jgi:hypothetical protein
MGFLSGIFGKKVDREASSLDVFFIMTGLYYGFYEKYGYDQKVSPEAMGGLYIEALKKANLVLNSLPEQELLGSIDFMTQVAFDSGNFPKLLRDFKRIPFDLNSQECCESFDKLLREMNTMGFNSGLSIS